MSPQFRLLALLAVCWISSGHGYDAVQGPADGGDFVRGTETNEMHQKVESNGRAVAVNTDRELDKQAVPELTPDVQDLSFKGNTRKAERNEEKEENPRRRSRRAIVPGTTWCGMGNVSKSASETDGVHVQTDRCCRDHDRCEFTIEAFSYKYGMFNYRFHTISHCECDDRFRSCLKFAKTEAADNVGRLFFNILGVKCFAFQRENVCRERNWWGKCIRQGTQNKAVLRSSSSYS